jgi:hypothetical protein
MINVNARLSGLLYIYHFTTDTAGGAYLAKLEITLITNGVV